MTDPTTIARLEQLCVKMRQHQAARTRPSDELVEEFQCALERAQVDFDEEGWAIVHSAVRTELERMNNEQ